MSDATRLIIIILLCIGALTTGAYADYKWTEFKMERFCDE